MLPQRVLLSLESPTVGVLALTSLSEKLTPDLLKDTECETGNVIQLGLNHPVKATICGHKSLLFMCVDVSRLFADVN